MTCAFPCLRGLRVAVSVYVIRYYVYVYVVCQFVTGVSSNIADVVVVVVVAAAAAAAAAAAVFFLDHLYLQVSQVSTL